MEKVSDNLLLFSRNLQANGAQFFWDTLYIYAYFEGTNNDYKNNGECTFYCNCKVFNNSSVN